MRKLEIMKNISKTKGTDCHAGSLHLKEIHQKKTPAIARAKAMRDIVVAVFAVSIESCFCSLFDDICDLARISKDWLAILVTNPSTTMALPKRISAIM